MKTNNIKIITCLLEVVFYFISSHIETANSQGMDGNLDNNMPKKYIYKYIDIYCNILKPIAAHLVGFSLKR